MEAFKRKTTTTKKAFLKMANTIATGHCESINFIIEAKEPPKWLEKIGQDKNYEWVRSTTEENHLAALAEKDEQIRLLKIIINKTMIDEYIIEMLYEYISHIEND